MAGDSNIHLYNIGINEEEESFVETVPLVLGVGSTSRTPISTTGIISYEEITETVSFSGKYFTITDLEYSGDVSVQYSAKKFFILKKFNLFLSGITQVNTFISRIVVKLTGIANAYSIKNAISAIRIKSASTAVSSISKNIIKSVSIAFGLARQISSKKNAIASILVSNRLVNFLSCRRNLYSVITVKCGGTADATVSQYVLMSAYTEMTLDEMKDMTLNELTYITV